MQTIAHIKYDQHVKESLLSGQPVEYSLKDFLPNENKKQKKATSKKPIQPRDYKMQSVSEVVSHVQRLHDLMLEQYYMRKNKGYSYSELLHEWHNVQTYKTLLCAITGEEYVYQPIP